MPDPNSADDDLALLATAARGAGEIALRYWKKSPEVWEKDAGQGPVTAADLAVNDYLAAYLRKARPDYGWLSEESPEDAQRLACTRVFVIDPIDGTRAFMAEEDHFAHSLAVVENGTVIAGAVYLPARDLLYAASINTPARLNGVVIHASTQAGEEGARLLSPKANFQAAQWPGGIPQVLRSFRPSIAYRLCLVAQGRHDGMVTLSPSWEWDIAAGSLIAARAGAVVSDSHGAPLRFNRADPRSAGVIAAAPGLHNALMQRRNPKSA